MTTLMLRESLTLLAAALLLAGCGRSLSRIGDAADQARIRTEHMADAAQSASNARQAEIFAQAEQIVRKETEAQQGPRYEAHKDGAGDKWIIYDNRTGAPAVIGTEVETGLTHAQAAARLAHMADDTQINFRK
jgi:hypothetical protein